MENKVNENTSKNPLNELSEHSNMPRRKEVVLVTGSSGCLGQFIVKLLQERDDNVEEIRLFDKKPYKNNLGHSEHKKMVEFVADITNMDSLLKAFDGVDCVIHTAADMDLTALMDDVKALYKNNVDGTQYIIDACIQKSVSRLIYTSTVEVVLGKHGIFYGSESTTPVPTSLLRTHYAKTKLIAENLVRKASGSICENGTELKTISLRPVTFYGENDTAFIYAILRNTKKSGGTYYRIRRYNERMQISYVGNVAWAHIRAKEKLAVDESISGENFFITDDTPVTDYQEHVKPIIEARGYKVSSRIIPYWFVWLILYIAYLLNLFISIFYTINFKLPSVQVLNVTCSTIFVERTKAYLRLDYQPIYTPEEAKKRSISYYKKVYL